MSKRLPNYGGVLPGSDSVGEFKPPWKVAPTCGKLNMRLDTQLALIWGNNLEKNCDAFGVEERCVWKTAANFEL